MSEQVHNAKFLCVTAGGSTNKSATEQGAVYVRYTGPNGRPTTAHRLLILLPQNQQMHGVAKGIKKGLEAVDIGNELLEEKLVGCTFDDASVMIAKNGGVTQQLQVKNWQTRYCYPLRCQQVRVSGS